MAGIFDSKLVKLSVLAFMITAGYFLSNWELSKYPLFAAALFAALLTTMYLLSIYFDRAKKAGQSSEEAVGGLMAVPLYAMIALLTGILAALTIGLASAITKDWADPVFLVVGYLFEVALVLAAAAVILRSYENMKAGTQ